MKNINNAMDLQTVMPLSNEWGDISWKHIGFVE